VYKDKRNKELAKFPLFANCTRKELAQISRLTSRMTVRQGTKLIRQGMPARQFFMVAHGALTVTSAKDGADSQVTTVTDGQSVGEIEILTHRPRATSVVALTDTDLFVSTAAEFRGILQAAPSVAAALGVKSSPELTPAVA
jgi:CRP-like cAMP-binding protein